MIRKLHILIITSITLCTQSTKLVGAESPLENELWLSPPHLGQQTATDAFLAKELGEDYVGMEKDLPGNTASKYHPSTPAQKRIDIHSLDKLEVRFALIPSIVENGNCVRRIIHHVNKPSDEMFEEIGHNVADGLFGAEPCCSTR